MALVAIDIGTTLIKCGRFNNGELEETWQYETKDSANIGADLLKRSGKDDLAMSSVVPAATINIEKAITRPIFRITPENQSFIKGFHPKYGADRVADTVAARKFYAPDKNLAVIAMGTCTVLTTITADGVVDGGFITLGLHAMINGLKIASPLVKSVQEFDHQQFDLDFGFTTDTQIANGTAVAQIGIVERWLSLARKKLGEPLICVATGGNASSLATHGKEITELVDYIDPHLTIKGIYLIASSRAN